MTVSELIEALQRLHGDPDLRHVELRVEYSRGSGKRRIISGGSVWSVTMGFDVAILTGSVEEFR